ncbi:MAG: M56 family metallopeptidase [Flavobacterium sp.]
MKDFLIESSVALAVFIALYHLLFEKENMHRFKRFYLLTAPVFAFAVPSISFVVEVPAIASAPLQVEENMLPVQQLNAPVAATPFDYNPILLTVYAVVSFFLLARIAVTVMKFRNKAERNETVGTGYAILVLLNEKVLPHTFMHYIFLNKEDYEAGTIEPELLLHEKAHVNQGHTFDILFIEVLKAIFWFNPLLWLYSRAIRLNHEFLADAMVIQKKDIKSYQSLLLEKAACNTGHPMASHINYSLTKKRLLMMTKKSSAALLAVKQLSLLPVIATIITLLCIDVQAQVTESPDINKIIDETNQGEVTPEEYFKGVRFIAYERGVRDNKAENGMRTTGKVLIDKKFEDLTSDERDIFKIFIYVPKPIVKKSPTAKELADYKNPKKYAIWIDGKNVPNAKLNNYKPAQIAYFSGSVILKNARTKQHPQPFQYWFYTHKHFDENDMGAVPKKYGGDTVEIWMDTGKITEDTKINREIQILQEETLQEDGIVRYNELDVRPEYPGGYTELIKLIRQNIISAGGLRTKENVYINYIIEKDGSVTSFNVRRASSPEIGEFAIKVFPADIKWSPGMKNGNPVRTRVEFPVRVE